MAASILSIGTAVPPTRLAQSQVRDLFAQRPGIDRRTQRLIHAAFDAAAIDHRHSVLDAFVGGPDGGMPVLDAAGGLLAPSTGARNDRFIADAPPLFAAASAAALRDSGLSPADVTHVITVSCTGMFAPGPDYRLVRDLGLSPATERYHLGFVGCAAAIPALRAAARLTTAQPEAVVLVACAELCSLHFRASDDPEQIVAASVFADGAGAAIVAGDARAVGRPRLVLDRFATAVTSDGESDMVWTVGDAGFEMTLSAEVPRIIGREIRAAVGGFLDGEQLDAWAVHPGGRSVLDRVESGLGLAPEALAPSRDVLRRYGNMSSATILFILDAQLRDDGLADGARIAALAFGPGLTVESAMLTRRTGSDAAADAATVADGAFAAAPRVPAGAP